jgi:hypothetical protein
MYEISSTMDIITSRAVRPQSARYSSKLGSITCIVVQLEELRKEWRVNSQSHSSLQAQGQTQRLVLAEAPVLVQAKDVAIQKIQVLHRRHNVGSE